MKQLEELNTQLVQGFYVAGANIVHPNMCALETGMASSWFPNLGGNPIATMNNVDQGYFVNPTRTYEYMNLNPFASSSGAKDNMDPRNFAVQQSDVGGSTVNYECFTSSMQLSSLMELSLPLKTMVLNLSEEDELLSTSTSGSNM
ncbi:hypothetical protein QJS10_CPB19g01891 [Acorus calamus]|uniref:Uncharacterized protein n=1 Tax=Acorus calamus TaxID=4465 RepID=A0AAV9CK85_ACOCL|nr:hypothetical protein QJS10_CPB19g01891 [Acorus calamus]